MIRRILLIAAIPFTLAMYSCSKKSHPARSNTTTEAVKKTTTEPIKKPPIETEVKKADSVAVKIAPVKRKAKADIPKVIVVNDAAAHKSVDGRLYYDMMGHRYWRNYDDGKYYLFNKSMYNDNAFKPR